MTCSDCSPESAPRPRNRPRRDARPSPRGSTGTKRACWKLRCCSGRLAPSTGRRCLLVWRTRWPGWIWSGRTSCVPWWPPASTTVAAGEHDLVVACWQMADALFRFYELRRYLTDWQQVNQVALHAAERAGLHEVEGRMHNGMGYVYAQQARFDQALEHLEAALVIRREVGDAAGEGRTLKNLGDVRIQLGQPHEALVCYEQALAISLAVGDRHRQGQALHGVGVALAALGRLPEAEHRRHRQGQALHGVGVALAALGRLPEAEHRLEEALWIRLEMGDEPGEARTRLWLGNVRRDQGWHVEARAEYEASLVTLRSVGDRYHEGIALWQIGVAAQQQGESDTARATWRQALAILEALGCTEAEEVRGLVAEEAPSS